MTPRQNPDVDDEDDNGQVGSRRLVTDGELRARFADFTKQWAGGHKRNHDRVDDNRELIEKLDGRVSLTCLTKDKFNDWVLLHDARQEARDKEIDKDRRWLMVVVKFAAGAGGLGAGIIGALKAIGIIK